MIITPQQNIILGGIATADKAAINELLRAFGIPTVDDLTLVRRNAMACPALPTCGLALAEAERYLPNLIDDLEPIVAELGLDSEEFTIRMTGCPNGCARPYVADIGLVGRTLNKYTIFLGGNPEGTRLNVQYRDLVPAADLAATLREVLLKFKTSRQPGERVVTARLALHSDQGNRAIAKNWGTLPP